MALSGIPNHLPLSCQILPYAEKLSHGFHASCVELHVDVKNAARSLFKTLLVTISHLSYQRFRVSIHEHVEMAELMGDPYRPLKLIIER